MSLREDIKEAWIDDLETTDAKQGNGQLKNEWNEYCCLGRLCEVLRTKFDFDIEIIEDKDDDGTPGIIWYAYNNQSDYEFPPSNIASAIGVTNSMYVVDVPEDIQQEYSAPVRASLADLNDKGVPFKDIARIIKESDL